jgi:hypothetical protein
MILLVLGDAELTKRIFTHLSDVCQGRRPLAPGGVNRPETPGAETMTTRRRAARPGLAVLPRLLAHDHLEDQAGVELAQLLG